MNRLKSDNADASLVLAHCSFHIVILNQYILYRNIIEHGSVGYLQGQQVHFLVVEFRIASRFFSTNKLFESVDKIGKRKRLA